MLGAALHWEAGHPRADHSQCAQQWEEIKALHDRLRYASGSAYNHGYCQHGGIFEGRGWGRVSGANGTTWANLNLWAYCFMSGPGYPFTPEAQGAVTDLVQEGIRRGTPDRVDPHSEHYATACPGDDIRLYIVHRGWEDWFMASEQDWKRLDGIVLKHVQAGNDTVLRELGARPAIAPKERDAVTGKLPFFGRMRRTIRQASAAEEA